MSEQKIALSEASEAQLRAFALAYLGIGFPHNAKAETMRARIRSAWSEEKIRVDIADEPSAPAVMSAAPQPGRPDQDPGEARSVKIIVQRTDDPGGDEPIPVGVNGRVMLVPRGEEVEIPEPYYEVLAHAVTHRYEALPDGGLSEEPRKVPMYPLQRLG